MSTPELPLTMPSDDDGANLDDVVTDGRSKAVDAIRVVKQPTSWLGIETDHRRLLEAGQDGWLHPRSGGFLLGRECFVGDPARAATRNAIPIRLVLDAKKLPRFQGETSEVEKIPRPIGHADQIAEAWHAPIPLYAATRIELSSCEERTRLLALVAEFSNVSIPAVGIDVGNAEAIAAPPATVGGHTLELPERLDAIQGAMTMATWAVPHIDPWIETLELALNQDAEGAMRKVARLAPWLRLPWFDTYGLPCDDAEGRLWEAAVSSLRSPTASGKSPGQLAELIAGTAGENGANEKAENWLLRTRKIVAAEETISPGEHEAGLAIQLVLLRPQPIDFREWSKELPWLPPGTWWAAAILCGWRYGFRALDRRFKGEATLQECLATRALAASWEDREDVSLPPAHRMPLASEGEEGCFSLNWGEQPVLRKRWNARAKWRAANLDNANIDKAARQLARELGWGCFRRRVRLQDVRLPVRGQGSIRIDGRQHLVVEGTVDLDLPEGARLDEEFDHDDFRRALAREAGVVTDPPMPRLEQDHFVPGLVYRPDFITREEELELVARIDGREWSKQLKRRVQQYGWRYDYRQREVDASMHLGGLPDWATDLARRLVDEGLMDEPPDQLIVNEYVGSQGISPHIDQPHSFAEQVATISLLETWSMVFRIRKSKRRVEKPLERRSVAVLTGDARYRWTHEIPARKYERVDSEGPRVKRERRISLTFRKVNAVGGEQFALLDKSASGRQIATGNTDARSN